MLRFNCLNLLKLNNLIKSFMNYKLLINRGFLGLEIEFSRIFILIAVISLALSSEAAEKENWVQFPPKKISISVETQNSAEVLQRNSPKANEVIKEGQGPMRVEYSLPVKDKPKLASQITFKGNKQTIVTTYGDGSTSTEVNTAIAQQVQWLVDKTTRLTTYRFADGRSHTEKEIIPAVISKPTYKGDLQTILTTFGDGTVKTQKNKAVKQRGEWSEDKKTKSTTFTFEDASEHVELQNFPPTVGAPTYKENTKTQTIFYGDGSTENKTLLAESEHITWSDDKLERISLFTFPDGSQHVEKNHIPVNYSKPSYKGNQQKITITYGDGTISQLVNKAQRTTIKWQPDKVTRLSEYYFSDGTIHIETEILKPENDQPIYKRNQQTIITRFPDGSQEKAIHHAISEKIDWAEDRETKLTTYEFPDGSFHQEHMMVKKVTEPAKYFPNEKIFIFLYGDGTSSKFAIKKTNEEEFISKTGTSKTVKRGYADGSFHFFEYLLSDTDQWVPKMATVADINNKRTQIFIKDFTFSGNTVIPDQRLRKEVANWINKPSDLNSLGHAVLAISNFYKDSGWLATADLPEQDLKEGMVHIHVTEARFGGVVVDQRNLGNIDPSLPLRKIEAANLKGQVLSLDAVETTTLMISEVPGVQASVSLVAGEKDGETQISLELDKAKTTEMTVSTDNAGARSTGQERQLFQLSLNGLFQQGETMQLQAMRSEGSEFSRFGINKIIHPNGLRLGINTSAMKYQLITPEYMSINAHGPSNSTGFDLMWPVLRNKSSTLSIQLNADDKKFNSETSLGATSKYQGKIYSLSLQGSTSAWSLGRGLTSASFQVSQGELDFSQSPDQFQDANGLQLAGLFQKIKMSASHAHKINARNNLTTSFQAQWASKNLDGSEKIYLGGPLGIRAYPTNESGGSLGQMLNIEWQHSLPVDIGAMTLAGFYDAGLTVINKFNDYPGALGLNAYGLKGGGMWWGWSIPNSLGMANLKLTWARRMGENPAKNSLGNDQDGSYVLDRFWLTLLQSF